MANIWLIIIFLIPIVLLFLLRVNAIFVYLGLCLGYVLSQFDGGTKIVTKLASSTKVIERIGGTNDTRLFLLLLPPILIMLFMLKTSSKGKYKLNILPSIAVGLLAVITVIPLLPISTAVNIMNGSLWVDVTKYEGVLVAASALIVVILMLLHRTKMSSGFKGNKHHKAKE